MKDYIKNNFKVISILVIVILIAAIGITFAYTMNAINVTIGTGEYGVVYSGSQTLNVSSVELEPILDSTITDSSNSSKVLKINFGVKGASSNPTDVPIIYDVSLTELDIPVELRNKYFKWRLYKNGSMLSEGNFSYDFDSIVDNRMVLTNIQQDLPSYSEEEDSYTFYIWISESCTGTIETCSEFYDQSDMLNKTFSGNIGIELSTKGKKELVRQKNSAYNTLLELNLADDIQTDTPDFSKTSCYEGCDEATVGIYSTTDDLGTSYYFRGDVENNYVKFGKWPGDEPDIYVGYEDANSINYIEYSTLSECKARNEEIYNKYYSYYNTNCTLISRAGKDMYWRIVRINGDGTVRMIYDGTNAYANGESSADKNAKVNNFGLLLTNNGGMGYMHGTEGATTYSETHSNTTDSDIKAYLEDVWYQKLSDTNKEYIADAIYCNDRSLDTSNSSYTGIGATTTYYAPYQRLVRATTPEPTLTCRNQNDRFTYNVRVDNVIGNDKLKEPVGLITADEVLLAGAHKTNYNKKFYLYTGHRYWTMSPSWYNYEEFRLAYYIGIFVYNNSYLDHEFLKTIDDIIGVRPVITLNADALKYTSTSNGTKEYPFTVTG